MSAQPAGVTHQTADAITRIQKSRCKSSAHITGRAGQQNEFIVCHWFDYNVPSLFVTEIFFIVQSYYDLAIALGFAGIPQRHRAESLFTRTAGLFG